MASPADLACTPTPSPSPLAEGAGEGASACVSEPGHALPDSPLGRSALAGVVEGTAAAAILIALCLALLTALPTTAATGTGTGIDHSTLLLPPSLLARFLAGGIAGLAVAAGAREVIKRTAYRRHWDREWAREAWELRNFPQGEQGEMVALYVSRGVGAADASAAICALSRYPAFFVDLMMTQELGMVAPEPSPLLNACVHGASFLLAGLMPSLAAAATLHYWPAHSTTASTTAASGAFAIVPLLGRLSPIQAAGAFSSLLIAAILLVAVSILSIARHKTRVALALWIGMGAGALAAALLCGMGLGVGGQWVAFLSLPLPSWWPAAPATGSSTA